MTQSQQSSGLSHLNVFWAIEQHLSLAASYEGFMTAIFPSPFISKD